MENLQILTLVHVDSFKPETLTKQRNQKYLSDLKKLRSEFLEYYHSKDKHYNGFVHTKIDNYITQFKRLKMLIEPTIQLTFNVHKITKITYLTAKGFWLTDEGKIERKFVKSIGRLDNYKLGIKDPAAIEDAESEIQKLIYNEYVRYY